MEPLNFTLNPDAHRRGGRKGGRREGHDPVYGEPDWDAPHHQRAELLPAYARGETCLYWQRVEACCGLNTRKICRAEDRCDVWQEHPDHAAEVARRAASWRHEAREAKRAGL